MRLNALTGVLLVCALAACDRSGPVPWQRGGVTFEQFVNTTVELRRAAASAASPAAFQARKREIEARRKVTDADLERFVREHGDDVKLLSAAWDSVEARLGRTGRRGPASRPMPQPPPVGARAPVGAQPAHGEPPRAKPKAFY